MAEQKPKSNIDEDETRHLEEEARLALAKRRGNEASQQAGELLQRAKLHSAWREMAGEKANTIGRTLNQVDSAPQPSAEPAPVAPSKGLELYRAPMTEVEVYNPFATDLERVSTELQPDQSAVEQSPQIHLAFVDQAKDAQAAARAQAETRLSEELAEGNGFARIAKSIWRGNIAREYYRQKYQQEAAQAIEESGDIYRYELDEAASNRAKKATLDRFQSDYEEALHGEKNEEVHEIVRSQLKDLIRARIEGGMSEEDFEEERNRIIAEHLSASGAQGKMTIDNFQHVMDAVRGSIEHGHSLDDVLDGMKMTFGESKSGVRTEADYSTTDKIIEKLQSSRVGLLVSPETIALATAGASVLARMGSRRVIGAAAMTIAPGVAAGMFAAVREHKIVKDERARHARDMAQGKKIEANSSRREEMNSAIYEMAQAKDLQQSLQLFLDTDVNLGDGDTYERAIGALAAVNTRISYSDSRNIDLIAYSDVASIEEERFALDVTRAKLKVSLEKNLSDDMRQRIGIEHNESIDDAISMMSEEALVLEEHISERDDVFKKLKARRVAMAGAKGAATGLTLGLISQEVVAGLDTSREGLAEQLWQHDTALTNGVQHQTVLQGLANGETATAGGASPEYSTKALGGQGSLEVSNDHVAKLDESGNLSLVDANGNATVEGLTVNDDGTLPQESIDALRANGMQVEVQEGPLVDHSTTETTSVGMKEYLANHEDDVTQVKREFWYDNDTPGAYENNEMKLNLLEPSAVKPGEINLSIVNMTTEGSSHHGQSVNWKESAAEGKLKLFVSGSKDTQSQTFAIPIGRDGLAHIEPGSPASKLFSVEDGKMVFHGAYAEVAQVDDIAPDGRTEIRPLATITGENTYGGDNPESIEDQVVTHNYEKETTYKITGTTHEVETKTEMAPVIPVVARRELERVRRGRDIIPRDVGMLGYGYGVNRDLASMRRWVNEYPERLRTRNQTETKDTDGKKRVEWLEQDGSPVERNVERERATITDYLSSQFGQSAEYETYLTAVADALGPMDEECRVAVNIPAYMEGKNLHGLLEEYMKQQDRDGNPLNPRLFEINIIINRREGTEPDNSVEVIEEFIKSYMDEHGLKTKPNIRYIDAEFIADNSTVGYARKVITDAVLLRGLRRENQQNSLYIESEDADLMKVDPRVVANLISKFDKNPHLDAVRGVEGRMPEYLKENDLLLMRRNAWEIYLANSRQKPLRDPKSPYWNSFTNRVITGGWNTGYTAEAYAMVGGYENVKSGEDNSIGERISMVRGDGEYPNLETIGSVPTRTESSPRRFINEIIEKKGAYEDFGNKEAEARIRNYSIPELMDEIVDYARITDDNRGTFTAEATMFYGWCRDATPTKRDARDMCDRVLRSVGYRRGDYEYHGDQVVIKNWKNVTRNLDLYRKGFNAAKTPNRKVIIGPWGGQAAAAATA